jgi:hypothetical protein
MTKRTAAARRHVLRELRDAARAWDSAYDRLPRWAQAGPSMIGYGGAASDDCVGWPALQGIAPPTRRSVDPRAAEPRRAS